MKTSFYSYEELKGIGFNSFGDHVYISRNTTIYKPESISIGNHVRIDDFCVLSGGSEITFGNYIHIGCFCALYGSEGLLMEDFSGLSSRVVIYSISDDFSGRSLTNPMVPDEYKPRIRRGKVTLRKHSIVGTSSTILPGVDVGEGAAIAAHSLVMKKCQPWTIYSGVPAVKISERSQKIKELEVQFLQDINGNE